MTPACPRCAYNVLTYDADDEAYTCVRCGCVTYSAAAKASLERLVAVEGEIRLDRLGRKVARKAAKYG